MLQTKVSFEKLSLGIKTFAKNVKTQTAKPMVVSLFYRMTNSSFQVEEHLDVGNHGFQHTKSLFMGQKPVRPDAVSK